MAAPIAVTPELLRLAWRDRRRPNWPPTFDECMADEFVRRLVRAEAVRIAQARRDGPPRAPPAPSAAAMPQPAATNAPALLRAPALRDLKRAAAGDTSDD